MELKIKMRLFFCRMTKYIVIVLIPVIFCPVPICFDDKIGYMAYTIMIMSVYWTTEVIPLAITALIPLVLFPFFGIRDAKSTISSYLADSSFILFGGLVVACAIEHRNLHKRIALRVLLFVGSKPRWLMFGFMSTTAFLSMWMSNTATTAMMIPIAQAVIMEIGEQTDADNDEHYEDDIYAMNVVGTRQDTSLFGGNKNDGENCTDINVPRNSSPRHYSQSSAYKRFCKGITLCIPYAANIGGTGALTGTGPNLVISVQVDSLYGSEPGLNFGTWMLYAFPGMVVCVLISWVWLQWFYLSDMCRSKDTSGLGKDHEQKTTKVIRNAYDKLGSMTFAEWAVLGHLVALVLLWMFRDPKFMPGWASFFEPGYVRDSTPAVLVSIILFMFPSEMPGIFNKQQTDESHVVDLEEGMTQTTTLMADSDFTEEQNRQHTKKVANSIPALLNWRIVNEKMPWDVLLIVGGGFALAGGCKESGLSTWLAEQLVIFKGIPPPAMAFIISCLISAVTEFTSNVATATIFLPILAELSEAIGVNPLYLMISGAIACSYAFMLPVATAPNAIAFAHKHVTVLDMVKTGFMLNILCVLVSTLSINTLGRLIFNVHVYPDWASDNTYVETNSTDLLKFVLNSTTPYEILNTTMDL